MEGFTIDSAGTPGQPGGAIYAEGVSGTPVSLTLNRMVLSNNLATELGGGVAAFYTDLAISQSRITGNAVVITGYANTSGAGAIGGGVAVVTSGLTVTQSTFDHNSILTTSPGGFMNDGEIARGAGIAAVTQQNAPTSPALTITDSTFAYNSLDTDGQAPGQSEGAGLFVMYNDGVSATNISNNTFTANAVHEGGVDGGRGGGAMLVSYSPAADFVFANNLSYANTAGSDPDLIAWAMGGWTTPNNLLGSDMNNGPYASLTGGVNGNITGVDPLLGTFGDHGGTTPTIPLLPGSPAIDAGTATNTTATDQRGEARAGATDIGAYEVAAPAPVGPVRLVGGILTVEGTSGTDTLAVWAAKQTPGTLRVLRNGQIYKFAASQVTGVEVDAQAGDDLITVNTQIAATYAVGGDGDDTLIGGDGYEILSGGAGNDELRGNGGSDRLNGNAGKDHLLGGDGDDRLYGGPGNDTLEGNAGDDAMWGDAGRDLFYARDNTIDHLFGGTRGTSGLASLFTDAAQSDGLDILTEVSVLIA